MNRPHATFSIPYSSTFSENTFVGNMPQSIDNAKCRLLTIPVFYIL